MMKTCVITLSKKYPAYHAMAGCSTRFRDRITKGIGMPIPGGFADIYWDSLAAKIHTIRDNYPLWEKRIMEVERGEACLSLREWSGRPYRSPQVEIACLTRDDGVGLQKLEFNGRLSSLTVDDKDVDLKTLAVNDGLSFDNWREWFKSYDLTQPMAIIHFTKFRY